MFHSKNATGAGIERISGFDTVADANGFIVAYPDSNPNYLDGTDWQVSGTNNDISFSLQLIQTIQATYPIAPSQVFLSGFSEGGGLVEELICANSAAFAGAGLTAKSLNAGTVARCQSMGPLKIVYFHGTEDPLILYNGGNGGVSGMTTLSAPASAQFWAANDKCEGLGTTTQIADQLNSGDSVVDTRLSWTNCENGTTVDFFTITGGGHTWPGGQNGTQNGASSLNVNASQIIWQQLH